MDRNDITPNDLEDEAGPEDVVKHDLTGWLLENGATDVYWEKENPWNHPTFRTNGADRPDLLVRAERFDFAIETKCDSSGVYRAPPQLQRYWDKYRSGNEQYLVEGEYIDPGVFVIATGHSPTGRLFSTEYDNDVLQTWDSWGGSQYPRKRGWLPMAEFNATKSVVRVMWQYAAEGIENGEGSPRVGIGALLSGVLDGSGEKPRLLYYLDGEEHWEGLL